MDLGLVGQDRAIVGCTRLLDSSKDVKRVQRLFGERGVCAMWSGEEENGKSPRMRGFDIIHCRYNDSDNVEEKEAEKEETKKLETKSEKQDAESS